MKTLWSWSRLRQALSRNDLRAALLGVVGGGIIAVVVLLVRSMDVPHDTGAGDQGWARLVQMGRDVGSMPMIDLVAWSEAWVPAEWRSWARPAEDLSWPPPDTSMECPPGAHCCPDIPEHPCQRLMGRWKVATPACPFESAPISELPWAAGHFGADALDTTGQEMWLGCQITEGKWHIVSIEVGPDGDALTEDDRVRGCLGPETGWPREFWRGWPVDVHEVQGEPVVPEVAQAPQLPWLTMGVQR